MSCGIYGRATEKGVEGEGGQKGQWSRTRVIVGNGGFFLSLPVASKASQRAGWLAAAAADGEVCVLQVPL